MLRIVRWALVVALAVAALGAPTAAAAECNDGDPRTSITDRTIVVNGVQRSYWVAVPPNAPPNPAVLVSLHGLTSNGCAHAQQSDWASFAIDSGRGFIAVFPNGRYAAWNFWAGTPDVKFLYGILDRLRQERAFDNRRVHVSGHSNGAYFGQRVMCDAEGVFASGAVYSGGSPGACTLGRGVAMSFHHGNRDFILPIFVGQDTRDEWAARNSCAIRDPAGTSESARVTYRNCRDGVRVEWTVVPGQSHLWPTGAKNDTMRAQMWSFFDAFPHPQLWPQTARKRHDAAL